MDIKKSLSSLGLTEKQAEVYTYLLKQPKKAELTVFNIAKSVNMPRSTVYLALEELESLKLVSSYKKNNTLHYLPADPTRLARDLDEKKATLDSILPTLLTLSSDTSHNPSVQTFTGEKGVRIVYDDCFNLANIRNIREFHTISNPKLMRYIRGKYFDKNMELKKKFNIRSKILVSETYRDKSPKEFESDSHRETRFIPVELPFEGSIIIYGNKTALFSHRDNEVYSMIVDSPAITEMIDSIFTCLWTSLARK